MQTIQSRIDSFVQQWQYYLFPDRNDKCRPLYDTFMKEIDELIQINSKSFHHHKLIEDTKKQKAKLFYLKGKLLDSLPGNQKSSQQFLNKSIKLNPVNGDCWNSLAHVLYKKKDYQGSQKAVEMALQNKGKNKTSLRYQSVLLRNQGSNITQKSKNVEQSVKLVKQALMLDMKDPATWFFLGNAYINNFFVNFKKVQQLQNAIKAYNQAYVFQLPFSQQKYFKHQYPDLFFNRASAQSHLQDYQKAIQDYIAADKIDKQLFAFKNIQSLVKRLQYIKTCFNRAKQIKQQKIQEIIKTIPNSIKDQQNVKIVSVDTLKQRYNVNKMLSVKVLNKLTMDNDIPQSFLAIDSSGKFLCVSIYNADSKLLNQKITKDTLIQIKDPELKKIKFKDFEYQSIQVFELVKVWVNGSRLTKNQFVPNFIVNTAVQK